MTDREIIKCINDGANYYVSMFGNAEHMEIVHKEFYSYVKPMTDEHGINIIYNVHIENLAIEQQKEVVAEMKALHMPIWIDLLASDELFFWVFGKKKLHGQTVFDDNDEIYMALLPDEKVSTIPSKEVIVSVKSVEEFALWAQIANDVLAGGYPDMHPIYHYPLCQNGLMKCYICYSNGIPVSVAAIMNNNGVVSLEFVATIPEMRRRGLAKAVCEKAVCDALEEGAKIITVRAVDSTAGKLYQSLGFKAYNYAI